MKLEYKNQLEAYLLNGVENFQYYKELEDTEKMEHWKGQVFGVIKVVYVLGLSIDTNFWLSRIS